MRLVNLILPVLLALSCGLWASGPRAQTPGPAEGLDDPVIAFNLSSVVDWSTAMPFLDVARTMRPFYAGTFENWETTSHEDLVAGGYLDAAGWPVRLPPGATLFRTGFDWSGGGETASRMGRYVLTYEGSGHIALFGNVQEAARQPGRIVFDNPEGRGFWLEIRDIDPKNYIRNISILREDRIALFQAGAIFNPDWLRLIQDARHLRFMDWMATNGSDIETWKGRPRPEDASWAAKGVPVEIMVRLANEIGAEPWFTMPHKADDAYVRAFATYVRDHLDPRLKAREEFSNEVWNGGFRQFYWVDRRAQEEWGRGAGIYYHAKRATEMALIWQDVFGAEASARLVNVLAGQAVNSWLTEELLTAGVWREEEPRSYVPPDQVFQEFAVTTYFGTEVIGNEGVRETLRAKLQRSPKEAAAWLTRRMLDPEVGDSVPSTMEFLQRQREVVEEHGLRLVAYEGGQHVHQLYAIRGISEEELDQLTTFMRDYVRSADMAALYDELWQGWPKVGQGPFMQYTEAEGASKWGSWGLYAYLGDRTPRSDLMERRAAVGGAWWGEHGGPQFRQGVIRRAGASGGTLAGTPEEDFLIGGASDDRFVPGAGADGMNGGDGRDTVVLSGASGDYQVRREGAGLLLSGPDGDKYLFNVEQAEFAGGETRTLADLIP
ncbi:calcium-binding protein [Albidovulum sediminicola]|uniref:Calcium-binding protein n=1 Tax=Albidovulum sediminicola TaxID=2984331 RepID=A0ABT2YYW4_9RHOB|nr:calcium-binding protein [Defluviimonas sp. WL0075]MCV2864049.1 hypothetical protein [Defluviimonas sp. WL0075]